MLYNYTGSQFAAWKDTIPDNPAPIEKTLSPITELVLAYAGPNAGEQCPTAEVHDRIARVAQMLECMTRKILREGRDLADTVYELSQIDVKKGEISRQVEAFVAKCGDKDGSESCKAQMKKVTQEWQQLCAIRMTLLAKRDRQHADLFSFTHKFPSHTPDSNVNYNKVCERELSSLTSGKQSRIIAQVTRVDRETGRERTSIHSSVLFDSVRAMILRLAHSENHQNNTILMFHTQTYRYGSLCLVYGSVRQRQVFGYSKGKSKQTRTRSLES